MTARNLPPDRIDAGPVVLVRNRVGDAEALAAAVRDSLDHLRPWMPWATEENATAVAQKARLKDADRLWEAGTECVYLMRLAPDVPGVVGAIGLHRRIGPGAVEIGYWTHADHAGRGYMTAAARAITDVAESLPDIGRVEIHTDEANVRSAAIPPKLGYRLERVDEREPQAPAETGRLQIWVRP